MKLCQLNSGFPPKKLTAPLSKRYVGLFYYGAYWRKWDEILFVDSSGWTVREVGTNVIRHYNTPLWANRFADQPFED